MKFTSLILMPLTCLQLSMSVNHVVLQSQIFKYCALPFLQVICHLFRTSLSYSTIPQDWSTHCIIPIYKSGDKTSVTNYKPISLLFIFSKVLERIVYNNIIEHVWQISTKYQSGFLLKGSTLQQLLLFVKHVLEPKCEVDVVYMHGFPQSIWYCFSWPSITKTQSCWNFWKNLWRWFQTYLKQRFQCVKVGDSLSKLCNVLSGVPWASVLGPLLFVIFINDLPEHIKFAIPFIFADDTKCFCEIRSAADTKKLQTDTDNAFNWSITSGLSFNFSNLYISAFGPKTQ